MLTKTQIDAAIRDCEGETVLNDGARNRGEGSLRLRIRKTDAGVNAIWFAHWKKAGERGKKQIGRYPDLSLADARTKFTDGIRPLVKSSPKPKNPPRRRVCVAPMRRAYAGLQRDGRVLNSAPSASFTCTHTPRAP